MANLATQVYGLGSVHALTALNGWILLLKPRARSNCCVLLPFARPVHTRVVAKTRFLGSLTNSTLFSIMARQG